MIRASHAGSIRDVAFNSTNTFPATMRSMRWPGIETPRSNNCYGSLAFEPHPQGVEFEAERLLIDLLEKARPEMMVHLKCCTNHLSRNQFDVSRNRCYATGSSLRVLRADT